MVQIFTNLLDPILSPLLSLPPLWGIILISFAIALIITIVYKFVTDQTLMKELKKDMEKFRKKMKELRDKPEKMMAVQKQAMEKQMQYMLHSLKPTLITFIPIILIFGWLQANMAFLPLMPDQPFNVSAHSTELSGNVTLTIVPEEGIEIISPQATQQLEGGRASWTLQGGAGTYQLNYDAGGQKASQQLIVGGERYAATEVRPEGAFELLEIHNERVTLFNLFGWNVGWLGGYIIFSMIFSLSIRKLLGVH